MAALRLQMDQTRGPGPAARGLSSAPYEVTAIRKDYVVLSSGTQERFVAKSAVRMIVRNLPAEPRDAEK